MVHIMIDVSELRKENAENIKELTGFLESNLGADIEVGDNVITLKDYVLPKRYLRVLIRKFLHRSGLKETYRPISSQGKIIVKRKKGRKD